MLKRIEQKLHNKYKDKIENTEYETMPALTQIQNYLRNLRRQLGNSNNLNDIKKFVESNSLLENLGDHDFFLFWSRIRRWYIFSESFCFLINLYVHLYMRICSE